VEVRLPTGFSPLPDCTVQARAGGLGALGVALGDGVVTAVRADEAGGWVPPGTEIALSMGPVRSRRYAGLTDRATVVTRTADGGAIDSSTAPPLELLVARARAASVTIGDGKAGARTWAEVRLVTTNPLPLDGSILVQLPAGMTLPSLPPYGLLTIEGGGASLPVLLEQLPGSVAYYQPPAPPYYALNHSLSQLGAPAPPACAGCLTRGATVSARLLGNGTLVPAGAALRLRLDGLLVRPWTGFTGTWQACTRLGGSAGVDDGALVDLAGDVAGWNVGPGGLSAVQVSAAAAAICERSAVDGLQKQRPRRGCREKKAVERL
jgi:hypothetical protein